MFHVTYYHESGHVNAIFDNEKEAISHAHSYPERFLCSEPGFCLIESGKEIFGILLFSEEDLTHPDGLEW